MNQTPPSRSGWSPLGVFFVLFIPMFFAVVVSATMITFILPESYASTTRIVVPRIGPNSTPVPSSYDPSFIQTQFELIQSELVLGKVSEELDLNTLWGKRFANGGKLQTADTVAILKAHMRLRLVNNTTIIEIRVLSEDRDEAATIANKIAQVFTEYARTAADNVKVETIDVARPSLRPARPNKPLNIVLGMVVGVVLGAVVGGTGAALTHSRRWRNKQPPAIP